MADKKVIVNYLTKNHPELSQAQILELANDTNVLESGVGNLRTLIPQLIKSKFKKSVTTETTESGVTQTVKNKMSKKRKIGYLGAAAVGLPIIGGKIQDIFNGTPEESTIPTDNTVAEAYIAYQNAGGDAQTFLTTPTAKSITLDSNGLQNILSGVGAGNMPIIGLNSGVYAGPPKPIPGINDRPYNQKYEQKYISKAAWTNQFPYADKTEQDRIKKLFIDAGELSGTAGISELLTAWNKWGALSEAASKGGVDLTPWDLLKIQGGFSNTPQVNTQISQTDINETTSRNLYDKVIMMETGKMSTDSNWSSFLKNIQKLAASKPTKTVTTTVGKTSKSKTTPGFGEADILAEAERYAQEDPRYKEYQTASVFGSALRKALGSPNG